MIRAITGYNVQTLPYGHSLSYSYDKCRRIELFKNKRMFHYIIILGILTRIVFLVHTGANVTSIKQKYFERIEVSVSSLTKKGGLTLLSTFYHLK